jgi:hypothetical protein
MITLTTPTEINSVLGGSAPIAYNKLVLGPFTMNGVEQTISGVVRLTATSAPTMQAITGALRINVPSAELVIEVPQLDFYRRIVLSGAQNTAILNQIEAAQAQIENGLVSLGVVSGTRTAGV